MHPAGRAGSSGVPATATAHAPASRRSQHSLEQIRDMAPSQRCHSPHSGLPDSLCSLRGPLPVPRRFRGARTRADSGPAGRCSLAQLLHVGRWPVARLSLPQLTETVLSQNATEQEKARLGTLGSFRIGSAPSGQLSQRPEAGRRAETTFPTRLWES